MTITVSYSENQTFRACPKRWQVGYLERWRGEETPGASSLGRLIHEALEALYDPARTPGQRLIDAGAIVDFSDDPRAGDAQRILGAYIDYAREADTLAGWSVVAVEQKFELPMPGCDGRYGIKGAIDLVVRNRQGQLLLVDHKSSAMPFPSELDTWTQGPIYGWAWHQLTGEWPQAVCWNGISTKAPPVRETTRWEPFRRVWDGLTPAKCEWAIGQLVQDTEDSWGRVRETGFDPSREDLPAHPSKENCRFCDIKPACIAGRTYGRDHERAMFPDLGLTPNAERTQL